MSIGADALASLTGNLEPALLVIHDYRDTAKQLMPSNPNSNGVTNVLAGINNQRRADTLAALKSGASAPSYMCSDDKLFYVQYNPSQLTLNASAVPQSKVDVTNGKSRTMAVEDAKLYLTCHLYFDHMQPYDAFMMDKWMALSGMSASGATNLARLGMEAMGRENTHSVQPYVESLIAALRDPFTRSISFRWADFSFIGQLSTVQAQYTMFNPKGNPIRAQVLLRVQHEMDPEMLCAWYKDYDHAFSGEMTNLVRPEQAVGNLLNLEF